MVDRKQADRIIFGAKLHHKQNLRSQIDQNLIDQMEIDRNPSNNYMNAYKNLYHDQLQKTVQMHEQKRNKQKYLTEEDRVLYKGGMRDQRPPMIDQTNMTSSQLSKYGKLYVDFDQQMTMKKNDHVKRNYDGGQAFFKSSDQHLQRQHNQALSTNQTLQNQMRQKEVVRVNEFEKKNEENMAFKELKYHQWMQDQQRQQKQKNNQMEFRQNIVNQIEQQYEKKHRKSIFNYQNVARHNPITNPIQYHIDNPYILKEIQNRNMFKSQSMYQNPRY